MTIAGSHRDLRPTDTDGGVLAWLYDHASAIMVGSCVAFWAVLCAVLYFEF